LLHLETSLKFVALSVLLAKLFKFEKFKFETQLELLDLVHMLYGNPLPNYFRMAFKNTWYLVKIAS